MKKFLSLFLSLFLLLNIVLIFTGCSGNKIKMYDIESKTINSLNFEDYIEGVVAGEMYNDWPIEALKTQAILSRTFALNFIETTKSKYNGADVSNDISECQAYNKNKINNKIKQAVKETAGLVIKYNNELINAWFHSNSGSQTEIATLGLNYNDDNPKYIKSVFSPETNINSQNYEWSYTFTNSEILKALDNIGISINNLSYIKNNDISPSKRSISLLIGDKEVNTNTFRLSIGSNKLKSTLITNIIKNSDSYTFYGLGYGHGVGLSQWGAKIFADQNKDYNYIINYYFDDVEIVKI